MERTRSCRRRFTFFERAPDAPPPQVFARTDLIERSKPIRDLDARDAYLAALDRDNLQDYENFLVAYPDDPMARRVRRLLPPRTRGGDVAAQRSVDDAAGVRS